MRIVIADDYADSVRHLQAFSAVAEHDVIVHQTSAVSTDQWAERLAGADALVLIRERSTVDGTILDLAPKLRIISCAGALPGTLDVAACSVRGIAVAASRGAGHATAELCWGMILVSERKLMSQINSLHSGRWQAPIGRQLHGRTLGLWGFGKIAQQVASYGRAFGMRVLIWGRDSSLKRARQAGLECATSLERFLADCDVVSVHLKLTPETQHLIQASDLMRMKRDALFVNTARAGLLAPGALEQALDAGRPGFAAIDVFDDEPLTDPNDSLLRRLNVLATPHIGFVELDNYEAFFSGAFENIRRFESGDTSHLVNASALAERG
jgi:D-3-phosphoglycerate dehydrogenase